MLLHLEELGLLDDEEDLEMWQIIAEEAARCRRKQFIRTRMNFGKFAEGKNATSRIVVVTHV